MKCPWCDGTGETGERKTRPLKCPRCRGEEPKRSTCPFCKTTGSVEVYSGEHVQSMIYEKTCRDNDRMRSALAAAGIPYEEEK